MMLSKTNSSEYTDDDIYHNYSHDLLLAELI